MMNGYDVKRWERITQKAKDLGLKLEIAGTQLELYRTGKAQNLLGSFEDAMHLMYFLDGYDWGRQLLSRKEEEEKEQKEEPKAKTGPFNDPDYVYWFPGNYSPPSLPPGCEWYNKHRKCWNTETIKPASTPWVLQTRRWPKPVVILRLKKAKFVPTQDNPKRGIVFVEKKEDSSCEGCTFDDPHGGCSMPDAKCCPSCGRNDDKTGIFVRASTLKNKKGK